MNILFLFIQFIVSFVHISLISSFTNECYQLDNYIYEKKEKRVSTTEKKNCNHSFCHVRLPNIQILMWPLCDFFLSLHLLLQSPTEVVVIVLIVVKSSRYPRGWNGKQEVFISVGWQNYFFFFLIDLCGAKNQYSNPFGSSQGSCQLVEDIAMIFPRPRGSLPR